MDIASSGNDGLQEDTKGLCITADKREYKMRNIKAIVRLYIAADD